MDKLPQVSDIDVKGKTVIVRGDLDTEINDTDTRPNIRLESTVKTVSILLEKFAEKVIIVGHKGRPENKYSDEFSTYQMKGFFDHKLQISTKFIDYKTFNENSNLDSNESGVYLVENLRFWSGEEDNDKAFAEKIVNYFSADAFVNESFAVSHREHASIVEIPKVIKEKGGSVALGLRLVEEVNTLNKILENPVRPVITVLSGIKKDKLDYLAPFQKFSDSVLVAGRLPEYLANKDKDPISLRIVGDEKVVLAQLNQDKEDITVYSIEKFEEEIKMAKTLIVAGPPGHYEESGQQLGTKRVLEAVVANDAAFKLAGGGDTEKAIESLNIFEKFDWISVGGGAMLDFLAEGTLPGIQAVLD